MRRKIRSVEDSVHGDESARVAGNCIVWVELMNRSVSDVLDLAA